MKNSKHQVVEEDEKI